MMEEQGVKVKNKGGRPKGSVGLPKDFHLKAKRYLEEVSNGLSMRDAAYICGASHDTIQRWRDRYPEFGRQCFDAQARFKKIHLGQIAEAGKKWWAASAWLLERTFPEEYAQKSTVAFEGNLTSEMVKRLNAGRERAAAERVGNPGIQPGTDLGSSQLLQ